MKIEELAEETFWEFDFSTGDGKKAIKWFNELKENKYDTKDIGELEKAIEELNKNRISDKEHPKFQAIYTLFSHLLYVKKNIKELIK